MLVKNIPDRNKHKKKKNVPSEFQEYQIGTWLEEITRDRGKDNDFRETAVWGEGRRGHTEIMMVVTRESDSSFSGIEPLSVHQGIFIFFLFYLR